MLLTRGAPNLPALNAMAVLRFAAVDPAKAHPPSAVLVYIRLQAICITCIFCAGCDLPQNFWRHRSQLAKSHQLHNASFLVLIDIDLNTSCA